MATQLSGILGARRRAVAARPGRRSADVACASARNVDAPRPVAAVVAPGRGAAKGRLTSHDGMFRVPPTGVTEIETLGLTAERCVELLDAREVSCRELAEAYLDRIEAHDGDLNAFVRTRRELALAEADAPRPRAAAAACRACRSRSRTSSARAARRPRPARGSWPGTGRCTTPACVTRVKNAGLIPLGKTNMDEFAMGSSTEHSAFGVDPQPVGPDARPGRVERRLGRRRRRRLRAARAGHRHRRLDPPAGGPVRRRRAEADLRRRLAATA